ncbi:hypothetical protein CEUSTIGMA_g8840.t1 [Chlamydomonas eustigma]|uniref:RRM domain-containing protein n=1 Tax=Chlamydomonas eustigma TaxID=1157962 RepID=A0A250XF52_9CHLO|nr:hypothetical protein CEUSTIGMA_g8840.t1 [Chlamydomonas eustigma]|eukprot:GAX81410.1 hypothetical protein CEUSTIGMA_g8840.t1 [Chlamydomonas eustigma]
MENNDFSIFVGDLGPEIDDVYLLQFFQAYYASARSAKVIIDPTTGRSKGYGFVRFIVETERDRSLTEMNGVFVGSRAIRVSLATQKKPHVPGNGPPGITGGGGGSFSSAPPGTFLDPNDPNNSTLFVGGLSPMITEDILRQVFLRYGDISYTKIPQGKGCGFVQFLERRAAEQAMNEMNGTMIYGSSIRISWGRSSKPGGVAAGGGGAAPAYHSAYGTGATSAAAYGGFSYDPYTGAYTAAPAAGAYGAAAAADPYAAYGYADPYAAYQYGAAGYGGSYNAAAGAHTQTPPPPPQQGVPTLYDPLAPIDVDKLNSNFMARQLPMLTGSFMKSLIKTV